MKRFEAVLLCLALGVVGCAGLSYEQRANALKAGACMAESEAIAEILAKPGTAKDVITEANEAFERLRDGTATRDDIEALQRADELLKGVVDCL